MIMVTSMNEAVDVKQCSVIQAITGRGWLLEVIECLYLITLV